MCRGQTVGALCRDGEQGGWLPPLVLGWGWGSELPNPGMNFRLVFF